MSFLITFFIVVSASLYILYPFFFSSRQAELQTAAKQEEHQDSYRRNLKLLEDIELDYSLQKITLDEFERARHDIVGQIKSFDKEVKE
jgi:hypothetical protein